MTHFLSLGSLSIPVLQNNLCRALLCALAAVGALLGIKDQVAVLVQIAVGHGVGADADAHSRHLGIAAGVVAVAGSGVVAAGIIGGGVVTATGGQQAKDHQGRHN